MVSNAAGGAGGGGEDEPIISANFETDTHSINGVSKTQAEVVSLGSCEITGGRLVIEESETDSPGLTAESLAALDDALAEGFTVFIDWDDASFPLVAFAFGDGPDYGNASWTVGVNFSGTSPDGPMTQVALFDADAGEITKANPTFNFDGRNKIAITIGLPMGGGNYRYAGAINGEELITDDVTYTQFDKLDPLGGLGFFGVGAQGGPTPNTFVIGGGIRSFVIYGPKTAAECATLTA